MDPIYTDDNFEVSISSETALLIKCKASEEPSDVCIKSSPISVSLLSGLKSSFFITYYPHHINGRFYFHTHFESSPILQGTLSIIDEENVEIGLTCVTAGSYIGGYLPQITVKAWTRSNQTIWCKFNLTGVERFKFETDPPTSDELFLNKWLAKIEELNAYDVKFVISGTVIKASKTLICAHSDVFTRMFDNDWKEKNGEIEIIDVHCDVMSKFIEALHQNKIEQLSDPLFALKMKQVAHKYNVAFVEKYAKSATINNLGPENIIEVLSYAHEHHEDDILEECITFFHKKVQSKFRDIPNVDRISLELCKLLLEGCFDGQSQSQ